PVTGALSSLRVQGTIQTVNPGGGSLAIAAPGRDPVLLQVSASTTILRNGHAATLADLKAGDKALAVYSNSSGVAIATSIAAQSADNQLSGWLQQVDAQRRISVVAPDGMPFLLQVGPQSQIFLKGQQIPFAQLTPGHSVVVTYQLPQGRGLPVVI